MLLAFEPDGAARADDAAEAFVAAFGGVLGGGREGDAQPGKLDSIDPDDGSVSGLALGIASLAAADVERLGGGRERADHAAAAAEAAGVNRRSRPREAVRQTLDRGEASGHGPQRHRGRFRLRRRGGGVGRLSEHGRRVE